MKLKIKKGILLDYKMPIPDGIAVIPPKVTEIAPEAFAQTGALEALVLPTSVRKIGERAFYRCRKLKTVTFSDEKVRAAADALEIGDSAFLDCHALETVRIPACTKILGREAFRGCKSLRSFAAEEQEEEGIYVPEGVTAFGESVFAECSAAPSLHLPAGLQNIGEIGCGKGALRKCRSLKAISFYYQDQPYTLPLYGDENGVYPDDVLEILFNSGYELGINNPTSVCLLASMLLHPVLCQRVQVFWRYYHRTLFRLDRIYNNWRAEQLQNQIIMALSRANMMVRVLEKLDSLLKPDDVERLVMLKMLPLVKKKVLWECGEMRNLLCSVIVMRQLSHKAFEELLMDVFYFNDMLNQRRLSGMAASSPFGGILSAFTGNDKKPKHVPPEEAAAVLAFEDLQKQIPEEMYDTMIQLSNENEDYELQLMLMEAKKKYYGLKTAEDILDRLQL